MTIDHLFGLVAFCFVLWLWFSGPRKPRRDDSPEVKWEIARKERNKAILAIICLIVVLKYFTVEKVVGNMRYIADETRKGIAEDEARERPSNNN